jgi:glycine cleavage system aminomethyltransferase T/glycine/D-amino acid oxidase-like deaminating enzyme
MGAVPRVVIIGSGSVGTALADELTARGWSDVTVLDQGSASATGGAAPQAPGLMFRVSASRTMTRLASYTAAKYRGLKGDGGPAFRRVGSLELAMTAEEMAELWRRHGWASSWGVASTILSPRGCVRFHPLLDPGRVAGGLYVPGDGAAEPLRAAEAQATAAAGRGARFLADRKVVGIEGNAGKVVAVRTEIERFRADVVVSTAGLWAPRIGAMVDLAVPLVPMAYQYAITSPLAALSGPSVGDAEARTPLLGHRAAGLGIREHLDQLGIAGYPLRAVPVSPENIPAPCEARAPGELRFTPEGFDESWSAARGLLPCLGDAEIKEGAVVLSAFTPDGRPVLGEHPRLSGFWLAGAVRVEHSAGVARAMANWMVDGTPGIDLHACDLNRFEKVHLSPGYVRARTLRRFLEVTRITHPAEQAGEPRNLRVSPFHDRHVALGGCFRQAAGWECPRYFTANENLPELAAVPARKDWASRHWSPIEGAEALVARERVALFDMTPVERLEIAGPGALSFLQTMTTNQLDHPPGTLAYTLMLTEDGGIRSDLTVARLAAETFEVGINGSLDLDWLRRYRPPDEMVQISDLTPGTCCIGVWGPMARELVQSLSPQDFSHGAMGYLRARRCYLGDVPVTALRISDVGELGWKLYTSAELGKRLWDALWEAGRPLGVIAAGRGAFDAMRLETGYRLWGVDMTTEHDPYEAGLASAVRMDKGYFLGREALAGRSAASVTRSLTAITLDDPSEVVMGSEPVYSGDTAAGYVTSAGYGYSVAKSIAYAWLPAPLAVPGTGLAVEYFGERLPATVAREPLLNPASRGVASQPS